MSLVTAQWTEAAFHFFVLQFLRAERQTNVSNLISAQPHLERDISSALDAPDLTDSEQNWFRLKVLNVIRGRYVAEIPADTVWHQVVSLTDADMANLYVTRHEAWTSELDNNELVNVAKRKKSDLRQPPDQWAPVVLWGHKREGPFTIIEGNHRLVSYVSSGTGGLEIPVLVGLSTTPCYWHPPDPPRLLVLDMWPAVS